MPLEPVVRTPEPYSDVALADKVSEFYASRRPLDGVACRLQLRPAFRISLQIWPDIGQRHIPLRPMLIPLTQRVETMVPATGPFLLP